MLEFLGCGVFLSVGNLKADLHSLVFSRKEA